MRRSHPLLLPTVFGFLLVALNPRPAHAYIDPGVGLLVVQGVIASAVGGMFFFRRMISQLVRGLFGKRTRPADEPKQPNVT